MTVRLWVDLPAFLAEGDPACRRPDIDPELFFPTPGGDAAAVTVKAKAVCGGCRFRAQCLEFALATGSGGVWGGTSERERKKIAKGRAAA